MVGVCRLLFLSLFLVVCATKAELSCSADGLRDINLDVAPEAVDGVVNVTTSLRFTCSVAGVGLETLTDPRLCFVLAVNDTTIKKIPIGNWNSADQYGTYLFSRVPKKLQGAIVFFVLTDDMEQNFRSQKYRINIQGASATSAATANVMPTTSAESLTTASVEQMTPSSPANLTASVSVPLNNMSDTKDSQEHENVITPLMAVIAVVAVGITLVVLIVVLWACRSYRKPHHKKAEISQLSNRTSDTVVNEDNKEEGDDEEEKFSAGEEVVQKSPSAPVVTTRFSENPIPRTQRGCTNQRGFPSQVDGSDVRGSQLPRDGTSSASGGDLNVQELRSLSSVGEDVMVATVPVTHKLVTIPSSFIRELTRRSEPMVEMQSEEAQDGPTYCFPCL